MKKLKILAVILSFILVFSGCASGGALNESSKDYWSDGLRTETDFDYGYVTPEAPSEEMESIKDSSASVNSSSGQINSSNRKLIHNYNLDVETLEFDSFISTIKTEVNALGGYIENSSVSGNSYNYSSIRYASFVCRIPSDKAVEFISAVGNLGNITYSYEDTKDITLTYVDTEARITSLQTEYDRLIELLAEADSIDSIIVLQQRISEVQYQLESYKSQLRTYDNLVDYSTVNLNIYEVKRITSAEQETVWERISSDFGDNIYDIWVDAQDFFVWFVANIPYFILWGILIAAAVLVIRFALKKCPRYKEKRAAKKAAKEAKKAEKLAKKNASEETEVNKSEEK